MYEILRNRMLFLIIGVVFTTAGLPQSPRFTQISTEEGLSQSTINCMVQDALGFMWFGTQDGLNRYDGYRFTVFRNDPENPNSISGNNIETLYIDDVKKLWVGTSTGLNSFDGISKRFQRYNYDLGDGTQLKDMRILALCAGFRDEIWVGTPRGLFILDVKKKRFRSVPVSLKDAEGISDNRISSLHKDHKGFIWIGTVNGLNKFNSETKQFQQYFHAEDTPTSLSSNYIRNIYEDDWGDLWIGMPFHINRFNRQKDNFIRLKRNPPPQIPLGGVVETMTRDQEGKLWVGFARNGLMVYDPKNKSFRDIKHDRSAPNGLISDAIKSTYKDRSGTLWIGTSPAGIAKLNRRSDKFQHYLPNTPVEKSINGYEILSVYEDQRKMLWIGTFDGSLNVLDRRTGAVKHFQHDPGNPKSLSQNRVSAICQDSRGIIWLGTTNAGLNRYDPETESFTRYRHDPDNSSSLTNDGISEIIDDGQGNLWIATGNGLSLFNPNTEAFTRFQHDPDNPKSLGFPNIMVLKQTKDGDLWVGTYGGGLNKFDKRQRIFYRYKHPTDEFKSARGNFIYTIYIASDGLIWIGTNGGGLQCFDPNTEKFKIYLESDGLPNDIVYSILGDDDNLWIATGHGMARFNPENKTFRHFSSKDGLQSNDFNQDACFKNPISGEMFFGGVNGITAFHPDSIREDPFTPDVLITDFKIFNKSVPIITDSTISSQMPEFFLKEPISYTQEITLTHEASVISLTFAATHYERPEENQFAYKLEGFDDKWIEPGNKNEATFTNLDPGKYILRVKAANYDGVWSGESANLTIRILPPWWRTSWAYLLYIGLALAAVFGFISFRTDQLKQRSRELEQTVAERTREIRQQTEELATFDGIVRTINRETVLEKVLHVLLEEGMKLFPQAQKGSFLLRNSDDGLFRFAIMIGYDEELLEDIALTEAEVLHRYTDRSEKIERRAYIVREFADISSEDKFANVPQPKSILAMAVVLSEKLEGFFILDNFQDIDAFNNSDIEKLSRFRQHAVSAIAKAKTLHELQQKNGEILRTQEQLVVQEKLASLGQLTAGIAHEIKNPLNFINNFAELSEDLVKDLCEEIDAQRDRFDRATLDYIDEIMKDLSSNAAKINEHGKRADGIVKGMLEHSRGKSGEFQEVDLNELLEEYLNIAYHGMRARDAAFNVTMEMEFDEEVGEISVVPQDISRVFLNILNNAFEAVNEKFARESGMSPTVKVITKSLGGFVEIRIRDNGSGIPQNIRDQIFNPFFTTKPTGAGNTGLGLSISFDIVAKIHHGKMIVETEEGEFTEFIIRLPRQ